MEFRADGSLLFAAQARNGYWMAA